MRPIQREIHSRFFRDRFDEEGSVILLEAPTGSGKTAIIIQLLLEEALPRGLQVVYLVRTRQQINRVLDELYKFRQVGNRFNYTFLTTREVLCPHFKALKREGVPEDMISLICRRRRWDDCKVGKLKEIYAPNIECFLNYCAKYGICPYRTLLYRLKQSDFIVMTYPYLFSWKCRKITKVIDWSNVVLVIDEVHNVNSMIDEDCLAFSTINAVKKRLSRFRERQALRLLSKVNLEKRRGITKQLLEEFWRLTQDYFEPLIWKLYSKLKYLSYAIRRGIFYFEMTQNALHWRSLIPISWKWYRQSRMIIGMTGTLPDIELLRILLFQDVEKPIDVLRSSEQIEVKIAVDVTSRWKQRNSQTYQKYASYIECIIKQYEDPNKFSLVVFPSYEMMHNVVKYYSHPYAMEYRGMKEVDLSGIETFNVVASGKFTEGVEFLDPKNLSRIEAVIIAGLPYPEPTPYFEEQVKYLSSKLTTDVRSTLMDGQMILRVRQALGRAIRSEFDKSDFYILDNRIAGDNPRAVELRKRMHIERFRRIRLT